VPDAFYTGPAKLIFKNDPPHPLFQHTHTVNKLKAAISNSEGKKLVKTIENANQQLTFWQYTLGL
jgi:hypothetical protein